MATFGGAKYSGDTTSPTKEFYRRSATAGLPKVGSGGTGGGGPSTPEAALERRPFLNVGKSSLNMFGTSPTVMAPQGPLVPMPEVTSGPKREQSPIELLDYFLKSFVMPILAPGSGQLGQISDSAKAWSSALEGSDPVMKEQAQKWKEAADKGMIDATGAVSGFYDQYQKINAQREGRSAELQIAQSPDFTQGPVIGGVMSGLSPLMFLQQALVRTIGSGTPVSADRIKENAAEYAKPDHGRLTPELVTLQEEFAKGEINEDQYRDLILLSGFGLTNPDPTGEGNTLPNAAVSLGLELFSDPLTLPLFGAGTLAKTSTFAASKVVLPSITRSGVEAAVEAAARAAGRDVGEFAGSAVGAEVRREASQRVATLIEEVTGRMKPNLLPKQRTDLDRVEAAMEIIARDPDMGPALEAGLRAAGVSGALVTRAPKIIKIGYSIDRAMDPLSIFNRNQGAARAPIVISRMFGEGYFDALGWNTVFRLDSTMRAAGISQEVIDATDGVAAMNHALQIGNEQNIRNAMKKQGFDMTANPTLAAKETIERSGGDVRRLMREQVDRTLEFVVAKGKGRADEAMIEWRNRAATQLTNMGATREAAEKAASTMSEREMRALATRHWGFIIKELDEATRLATPVSDKFADDMIRRVINIGPHQMTAADLKAVLKAVKDRRVDDVLAYVNRFDDLRFNVNQQADPRDILIAVEKLATSLKGTMPTAITDRTILPKSLVDYLDRYGPQGYNIGLRPPDDVLAKPLYDEANNLIGVSSWIDNVTERAAIDRVNRTKVWQNTLFRGISGSEIERNASRRFAQSLADDLGLSQAESQEIMRTLKEVAEINQTSPRGLNGANVSRALKDARLKNKVKKNIPARVVTDAIAYAYENELMRVGATQKFTGRIKTKSTGLWDNWMGWVSENLYPKVRFTKSPIFILQELTEYPYFMALRGMFPWRHNLPGQGELKAKKQLFDEKTLFLMDYFRTADTFVKTDMIEQSDLVRMGFAASRHIADSTTRFGKAMQTVTGSHLYRSKAEAEAVIWRERMGKLLRDSMMEESPATWNAVRAYYPKGFSDGEVATEWLHDLIARANPDAVWTRMSPEMFRPSQIGRRARPSSRLIGYIVGGESMGDASWTMLRKRVANPKDELTFDFIERELRSAGADAKYIERARSAIEFPLADDFYKAMETGGVPAEQVAAMRSSDELDATRLGKGLNEYLSDRWAEGPQSLDQFGDRSDNFMFQLIVDSLGARGLNAPERADPILDEMRRLGDEKQWHWPQPETFTGKAVKDMTPAEKKADRAHKARAARVANPDRGKPPKIGGRNTYDGSRHTIGEPTYDQWLKQLEKVFPNINDRIEMADWYTDMRRGMLALFSGEPSDQQVKHAAEMIVAFAVTQANTSPADGMQFLYRVLSMARRGEDWPSALGMTKGEAKKMLQQTGGLNQSQLDNLIFKGEGIDQEGIGEKLADFIDSLIGNERRSVGVDGPDPNAPWGPVAGDVWAKRDMGYLDEKMGRMLHLSIDGGVKTTPIRSDVVVNGKAVNRVTGYRVTMDDGSEKVFEQVGNSVPTAYEYDHIVEFYNGLSKYLNDQNYLGRRWTPADAQAVGWFKAKTTFGDATGDPRSAFFKGRWSAASELTPSEGTPLEYILPSDELTPESLTLLHDIVARDVIGTAAMRSGVNVINKKASVMARDGAVHDAHMVEILADRDAAEQYLARQAFYSHADSAVLVRAARQGQKYDYANGVGGAIEMRVASQEEGEAIIRGLAEIGPFSVLPSGAHLATTDDGSYVVRALWDGPGDVAAFKAAVPAKQVLAELSRVAGRPVTKAEVSRPTVEFIKVANNWKDQPNGGAYLDLLKRGSGRGVVRSTDDVESLERAARYQVAVRAEDAVQTNFPREAAVSRTRRAHDGPFGLDSRRAEHDRLLRDADESADAGDYASARALRERAKQYEFRPAPPPAGFKSVPSGDFYRAVSDAADVVKSNGRRVGETVYVYDEDEYKAMRTFLSDDGKTGYAIKQNGDLVSVFNVGPKGRIQQVLETFPVQGGTHLDAFDEIGNAVRGYKVNMNDSAAVARGRLTALYEKGGYREVRREPWNPEYAPPGWKGEEPDVVFMEELVPSAMFQKAPRGTRAAIVRQADNQKDTLFLNKPLVREDTLLHELVHKFAYDLDPSAVRRIKGIKAEAEGHTLGARGATDTTLNSAEQEWLVDQYLVWAKSPDTIHPTLHPLLSAFRESIKGKRQAGGKLHPSVKAFLDDQAALAKQKPVTPYWYDVDEEAMFNWAMVGHRRASKAARDLIHFRGERSLVERSMNHPFFGMYPLSYMWGKVLPELTEFLMFRPFGLKMPLVAFNTANRMYQSFMHQQAYDEELRQYLYKNEPAMRAVSMFIPGVPWDLPVNTPLWSRRIVEGMMTNQQRELEGKEPLEINLGKIISDQIGYQIGVARSATTIPQTIEAAATMPNVIGRAMGGEEPLPEDTAQEDTGPFTPPGAEVPAEEPQGGIPGFVNEQMTNIGNALGLNG
jgi:hypothetical protein